MRPRLNWDSLPKFDPTEVGCGRPSIPNADQVLLPMNLLDSVRRAAIILLLLRFLHRWLLNMHPADETISAVITKLPATPGGIWLFSFIWHNKTWLFSLRLEWISILWWQSFGTVHFSVVQISWSRSFYGQSKMGDMIRYCHVAIFSNNEATLISSSTNWY